MIQREQPLTTREMEQPARLTLDGREERICRVCEAEAADYNQGRLKPGPAWGPV